MLGFYAVRTWDNVEHWKLSLERNRLLNEVCGELGGIYNRRDIECNP